MSIYVLPDTESIIVAYLKAHADVIALVDPRNIATETPAKLPADSPFLIVTLIGGTVPVERHLLGASVQIDVWGGQRLQARNIAAIAHAALIEMVGVQTDLGIITGVETLISMRKLNDALNNRPRYLFEVRVFVHP